MTDFEDRLSTALRSAGAVAPDATGLVDAARGRAQTRGRRRTALASVAAVVGVAGVVGGVALMGDRDTGQTTAPATSGASDAATTSSPDTPVSDSRVESWRDISVLVPADYGYGNLSTWCLNGKREPGPPVVERPGGAVPAIGCIGPQAGYGVAFGDANAFDPKEPPGKVWQYGPVGPGVDEQSYPDGAWLGYLVTPDGQSMVQVSLPTRAEAQSVLDSFALNTRVDANGCAPRMGGEQGVRTLPGEGQLRLCRYAVDGWLEQSELRVGQDAADAEAALDSAPTKGDRMCTMALEGPTVVVATADAEGQVTLDACQGFSWAGKDHDLTADVLYWVLSPGWSGAVDGDVPMPGRFRRLP